MSNPIPTPQPSVAPGEPTHAYRGFLRCGHLNYLAIDTRDYDEAESLADDIAEIIRNGGWVDRVSIVEARVSGGAFGCPSSCPLSPKNSTDNARARVETEARAARGEPTPRARRSKRDGKEDR